MYHRILIVVDLIELPIHYLVFVCVNTIYFQLNQISVLFPARNHTDSKIKYICYILTGFIKHR